MTDSQIGTDARNTAALVAQAQAGDQAALAVLVSAHLPLVYGLISQALGRHPDVDDLVQETMVRVMRGLPALREPDRFRSWVSTIAHRQVQLHLRSRKDAVLSRQEVNTELPDPSGDFADQAVTALMLADQRRELAEAARWLDDDDRRLLALWWRESLGQLTRADLAAALSVGEKHASVRLRRMKVQLDAARLVVRALHASPRCAELDALVRPWKGTTDALWRKRLSRHVRACPRCGARRDRLLPLTGRTRTRAAIAELTNLSEAALDPHGRALAAWSGIEAGSCRVP